MNNFQLRVKNIMNFMAYSRNEMNNQLAAKVLGGLHEYAKCTLASKNNLFKLDKHNWISHWCREYIRLIGSELISIYYHDLKRNFNREKILDEVIKSCKSKINTMITIANNMIKRDFKLEKLKYNLTILDFDHFWNIINVMNPPNIENEYNYQHIPIENR